MTIQWYPGHMHKARKEIREAMKKIDIVIEILDSRLPHSSRNPVIEELRGNKACIRILNKSDLADPAVTKLWLTELKLSENVIPIALSASKKGEVNKIPELCKKLVPHTPDKPARAMIMGIPNVGKSTLINTLSGRKVAMVGDKPAVTKQQQKTFLKDGMTLNDTPGILWPNLGSDFTSYRLAASGAIRDAVIDFQDVAAFAGDYLLKNYEDLVMTRYKLKNRPDDGFMLVEEIGKRRGCLRKGGIIDMYKAAEIFLHELRGGQIGRISLERPDEIPAQAEETEDTNE